MGMQIGIATIENSMGFLKKLRIELPYDPAIPFLGIYPKNIKTLIQKDIWKKKKRYMVITEHQAGLLVLYSNYSPATYFTHDICVCVCVYIYIHNYIYIYT